MQFHRSFDLESFSVAVLQVLHSYRAYSSHNLPLKTYDIFLSDHFTWLYNLTFDLTSKRLHQVHMISAIFSSVFLDHLVISATFVGGTVFIIICLSVNRIITSANEDIQSSLFVYLSVSNFAQKLLNGFAWNLQRRLAIGQWTYD